MKLLRRAFFKKFKIYFITAIILSGVSYRLASAISPDLICVSGNQKIWYIAIGIDVFALPYSQFFDQTGGPTVDNLDQKFLNVPPNPKAPVGCKDNPQQVTRFAVLNRPNLEPQTYSGPMPQEIYKLEMYTYPNRTLSGPKFDPIILALFNEAINCNREPLIKRWDDGTLLCSDTAGPLNPALNNETPTEGIAWEFIISGNLYLTPMGQNLVENEFANVVDVTYLISPGIVVHYEWWPTKYAKSITPNYLINVDKLFLQKLYSYRISNYKWKQ